GAGRGTKTVLINRALQRQDASLESHYLHVAVDLHDFKIALVKQRIEQYGLKGVQTLTADIQQLDKLKAAGKLPESFDAVFIDAPCSGSGTLRRHPEIRWQLQPDDVTQLSRQATEFLQVGASFVKPGGTLTYATCSIFYEENGQVIKTFLSSPNGASFQPLTTAGTSTPHVKAPNGDTHYLAILKRQKGDGSFMS
ncbi:MAG: methyltransferase domain-containing protein, partial [Coriobacteriales bacterium]|nr:methyltransferase domain-containing protein [Coriobacteriales bacterium]